MVQLADFSKMVQPVRTGLGRGREKIGAISVVGRRKPGAVANSGGIRQPTVNVGLGWWEERVQNGSLVVKTGVIWSLLSTPINNQHAKLHTN